MLIKFFSCEKGCSFEGGIHLGQGPLSDNYGKQTIPFLAVTWLLFVKGHKIESQRDMKNKYDFGVVLLITHIHHYFYKVNT